MNEFTKGELKIDFRRPLLVFAANNKIFAECTSEGLGLDAAKANAKELIRRWNALEKIEQQRDDLLDACEMGLSIAGWVAGLRNPPKGLARDIKIIEAAIANCKA